MIYLPIAEISVNLYLLFVMGVLVGMLSGIFGVGGGFLMTPLLIFIGVPPVVAVGTEASQIVAASASGAIAHWRKKNIDIKMGCYLLVGGVVGSIIGVFVFAWLRTLGQIDVAVKLTYVLFLSVVGLLMFQESLRSLLRSYNGIPKRGKLHMHIFLHGLPFRTRFSRSRLYISALLPLFIGGFVGFLSAIMGVGGGFIMIPAMIYLLGMPMSVVVGTSLFQILFVTANATFFQASINQSVDLVLAFFLILGGSIGAQFGAMIGSKLNGERLRILLAGMVLLVCFKLLFDLVSTPVDLFSIEFVNNKV